MDVIRVLVIDDSAFMRKMITEILASDERIDVIATARNGEDGLKKIKAHSPDVVTLDIEMPVMDGITTLQHIMEFNPIPVIMLSSLTQRGAAKTFEAISNGAVDFIAKPSGPISLDINNIKQEIISKVIIASNVKVKQSNMVNTNSVTTNLIQPYDNSLVLIGTSTGGPRALQHVLTTIPSDFPAPILVVQHMPPRFTKSLAERLDSLSQIEVKEASHGEILQNGVAYIAPGDFHMKIREVGKTLAIELTQDPHLKGHRPAVDVLFQSAANLKNINKIAVVLTGMGKDGSEGIKSIKERDSSAFIIAESEDTAIVYGMPAAAVDTGYVDKITHINQVGEEIINVVNKSRRV